MAKVNQCAILLNHLMRHGRVDREQAVRLGIKDLPTAVWTLRRMEIETCDGHYELKKPRKETQVRVPFEDDLFPNYENE